LRRDDGFTMIELLLVCVISLIVFGATVTAWTSIYSSNRALEGQQDNAETARVALDRAARQLRNLANPTVNAITTIDRATDYDFIFQTSDPSKTWVRYCLQTSGGGNSVGDATLWESESASAVSGVMRTACPGTGWDRQTAVVEGVTNQAGGIDRNIFDYECSLASAATCPADTTEYSKITNVGIDLWVDADNTDRVSELNVATGVFLRNQNEGPTALVSEPHKLQALRWFLNGSGSSDPEGRTLEYFWFEGAPPTTSEIASTPCTQEFEGTDWRGVTYAKKFQPSDAGQSRTFYLLVRDPGCLTSLSTAITINPVS
jgi:prepilin-type N-terminal cleavage/methylation domain-containing protein